MKTSKLTTAAVIVTSIFSTCTFSFAQQGINTISGVPGTAHVHAINPQKKAASDSAMQAGLQALQAANSAEQGGGGGAALGDLQQAITSMTAALPIYDGYRERSIDAAKHAITVLGKGTPKAITRAEAMTGKAITDAQTALTKN